MSQWEKRSRSLTHLQAMVSRCNLSIYFGQQILICASNWSSNFNDKYQNCIYWTVKWATSITGAETSAWGWLGGGGVSSWAVTGRYSISFFIAFEHWLMASALLLPSNCILTMRLCPCRNPQMCSICICQSQLSHWKHTLWFVCCLCKISISFRFTKKEFEIQGHWSGNSSLSINFNHFSMRRFFITASE